MDCYTSFKIPEFEYEIKFKHETQFMRRKVKFDFRARYVSRCLNFKMNKIEKTIWKCQNSSVFFGI